MADYEEGAEALEIRGTTFARYGTALLFDSLRFRISSVGYRRLAIRQSILLVLGIVLALVGRGYWWLEVLGLVAIGAALVVLVVPTVVSLVGYRASLGVLPATGALTVGIYSDLDLRVMVPGIGGGLLVVPYAIVSTARTVGRFAFFENRHDRSILAVPTDLLPGGDVVEINRRIAEAHEAQHPHHEGRADGT